MADDEEVEGTFLVCGSPRTFAMLPGSTLEHCDDCGAQVTVSPEGHTLREETLAAKQPFAKWCFACATRNAGDQQVRAVAGAAERAKELGIEDVDAHMRAVEQMPLREFTAER